MRNGPYEHGHECELTLEALESTMHRTSPIHLVDIVVVGED